MDILIRCERSDLSTIEVTIRIILDSFNYRVGIGEMCFFDSPIQPAVISGIQFRINEKREPFIKCHIHDAGNGILCFIGSCHGLQVKLPELIKS